MRSARPRLFHGLVAGLSLVAIFGGVALAAWLALDILEWLAGVMQGNG